MFGVSCISAQQQSKITETPDTDLSEEKSRILQIDGIDCECCVCFITVKVREIPGVKSVTDLSALGMVVIEYYESKVSSETLIEAVEEIGFKLTLNSNDSEVVKNDNMIPKEVQVGSHQ